MGWYDPNEAGILTPDQKAAAEAVAVANADAKFRTDLIAVLREIRDTLRNMAPGSASEAGESEI